MKRYLAPLLISGVLLAACGGEEPVVEPAPSPTPEPSPTATATGGGVEVELEAEDFEFEVSELSVAAGAHVQMKFKNRDDGIPHNFALYDSPGGSPIFQGEIVDGDTDVQYAFDAPAEPGSYHFQCDVHPQQMTGTFLVT